MSDSRNCIDSPAAGNRQPSFVCVNFYIILWFIDSICVLCNLTDLKAKILDLSFCEWFLDPHTFVFDMYLKSNELIQIHEIHSGANKV